MAKCLPETRDVAVALIVVRGDAGAEEVQFGVAGELDGGEFAFDGQVETRLTRAGVEFRRLASRVAGEWDAVERTADIRPLGLIAENRFCRHETARRNADTLVMNGRW